MVIYGVRDIFYNLFYLLNIMATEGRDDIRAGFPQGSQIFEIFGFVLVYKRSRPIV
jgi:hypothetical protein